MRQPCKRNLCARKSAEEYVHFHWFAVSYEVSLALFGLKYPELGRTVSELEYDELIDYALDLGIENSFMQEGGAAEESFIPSFDFEGVLKSS